MIRGMRKRVRLMRSTFSLRVESLIEMDGFIERAINTELKRKEKELIKRLEQSEDEEEQDAIREYSSDEFYLLEEQFPKNYRYSMVVSAYSLLEQTMVQLCKSVKDHKPTLPEPRFGRAIIWKAKEYLVRYGEMRFRDNSRNWSKIEKYNKIRNTIAHVEGEVERNELTVFRRYARSLGSCRLDSYRHIQIDRDFVPEMLRAITGFVLNEMLKGGSKIPSWMLT